MIGNGESVRRTETPTPVRLRAQTRTIEPWVTGVVFVLVALSMSPVFGAGLLEAPFDWPQAGVLVLLAWWTAFGATSGVYPSSRGMHEQSGGGAVRATWPLRIRVNNGVILPAFFPTMAGWAGPWLSGRALVPFVLFTGFALFMAVVLWRATADSWRVDEIGVERLAARGTRSAVIAWSDVVSLSSDHGRDLCLHTARGEVMRIPLQLDGIGDLARLAIRRLPEASLSSNQILAEMLRDLAADRWLKT